jgi:uncharacterized membrane protein (UPF0127 family)
MTPLLLSLLLAGAPASGVPDGGIVTAKGHRFLAEVARTPQEQARGLMYRQALARDRCMIFLYDEDGQHPIWMKNCLIALDVVWIRNDGTVVETSENTPPCSPLQGDNCPTYGGTKPARHFVEFPAGTLRRLGLKIGDRLGWKLTLDGAPVAGGAPGGPSRKGARTPS